MLSPELERLYGRSRLASSETDLSDELCDVTMYTVDFRVNLDQLPLLNALNVSCLYSMFKTCNKVG